MPNYWSAASNLASPFHAIKRTVITIRLEAIERRGDAPNILNYFPKRPRIGIVQDE
jgi:hypothetical protein